MNKPITLSWHGHGHEHVHVQLAVQDGHRACGFQTRSTRRTDHVSANNTAPASGSAMSRRRRLRTGEWPGALSTLFAGGAPDGLPSISSAAPLPPSLARPAARSKARSRPSSSIARIVSPTSFCFSISTAFSTSARLTSAVTFPARRSVFPTGPSSVAAPKPAAAAAATASSTCVAASSAARSAPSVTTPARAAAATAACDCGLSGDRASRGGGGCWEVGFTTPLTI
mmetsp:Transcript_18686/g.38015  ORF Transcript_18686/g.38015 Transcript_18686/m.38015 type:complete len:227 (+) Transcript_18686:99-779(+)